MTLNQNIKPGNLIAIKETRYGKGGMHLVGWYEIGEYANNYDINPHMFTEAILHGIYIEPWDSSDGRPHGWHKVLVEDRVYLFNEAQLHSIEYDKTKDADK